MTDNGGSSLMVKGEGVPGSIPERAAHVPMAVLAIAAALEKDT